jgi:AcrR family transcriptional regulator
MFPMSTSTSTSKRRGRFPTGRRAQRGSYHHGDLRQALISAALALVEERGPHGFTLREAARLVGVTHTAPYRHFADKNALLAAVALDGFEGMFQSALAQVATFDTPAERLQAIGVGYVEYAVAHPSHFRVMYAVELDDCTEPGLLACKEKTYGLLIETIVAGQASGAFIAGPTEALALSAWSIVHGLAELLINGAAGKMGLGEVGAEAITCEVTTLMLSGLAPRA